MFGERAPSAIFRQIDENYRGLSPLPIRSCVAVHWGRL